MSSSDTHFLSSLSRLQTLRWLATPQFLKVL